MKTCINISQDFELRIFFSLTKSSCVFDNIGREIFFYNIWFFQQVSSKKKKSDHPTPTKPAFYKDKGESDNSDNVPVLSSANLLNTGVQGGGNNYRVSEHPHVSPIKEVDESVLATTLYSKYNSKCVFTLKSETKKE